MASVASGATYYESGGTPQFFKNPEDYNRFYTRTVAGLLRGDLDAPVGGPAVASADNLMGRATPSKASKVTSAPLRAKGMAAST